MIMAVKNINDARYLMFLFVFAMTETLLVGGIIMGWSNLVVVFKFERFYLNLCPWLSSGQNISSQIHDPDQRNMTNISQLPYCPAQDRMFNLIFTISKKLSGIAWLPGGILIDKCGPFIASIGSGVIFIAAVLTLALTKIGFENLLFLAFILFSMSTNVQAGCVLKVCSVAFSKRKSLVLCVLNGAFDTSAVVFAIFKLMYDGGFTFQQISLQYAGVCAAVIVSGVIFFIPTQKQFREWAVALETTEGEKNIINKTTEHGQSELNYNGKSKSITPNISLQSKNIGLNNSSILSSRSDSENAESGVVNNGKASGIVNVQDKAATETTVKHNSRERMEVQITGLAETTTRVKSIRTSILSSLYICHLVFLCTIQIKLVSFAGSVGDQVIRLSNHQDNTVSWYVDVFGYTQFGALLVTPILGIIFDRDTFATGIRDNPEKQPILHKEDMQRRKLKQFIAPFVVTVLLSIILCILSLFEKISLQIPQYILYTIVRPLLYATHGAYISVAFPTEHFGTLFGLALFSASICSLFNYPLFEITVSLFHGNFFYANVIVLFLVCCAAIHPVNVWRKVKEYQVVKYPVFH